VDVEYGLYKKPCFDEVFQLFRKYDIIKEEDELIVYGIDEDYKSFNGDFVKKREYIDKVNCIKGPWKEQDIKLIAEEEKACSIIQVSILYSDLEKISPYEGKPNSEVLLEILNDLTS